MVLDVVCEQIVEKRFEGKEMLKMYGIKFLGLTLGALLITLGFIFLSAMPIIILLLVGLVWLCFKLFRSLFVEYEYDLVNGDFEIDKIVNKTNRSNLLSISLKDVDKFYPYDIDSFNDAEFDSVLIYSYSVTPADAVVLVYPDKSSGRTALIISPDDRMLEGLKKCVNRMVVREGFAQA